MNLHEITAGVFSSGRLPNATEKAKSWRDSELSATDWIVQTPDHPQKLAYEAYRTLLRDWPESETFPATRPTL